MIKLSEVKWITIMWWTCLGSRKQVLSKWSDTVVVNTYEPHLNSYCNKYDRYYHKCIVKFEIYIMKNYRFSLHLFLRYQGDHLWMRLNFLIFKLLMRQRLNISEFQCQNWDQRRKTYFIFSDLFHSIQNCQWNMRLDTIF